MRVDNARPRGRDPISCHWSHQADLGAGVSIIALETFSGHVDDPAAATQEATVMAFVDGAEDAMNLDQACELIVAIATATAIMQASNA